MLITPDVTQRTINDPSMDEKTRGSYCRGEFHSVSQAAFDQNDCGVWSRYQVSSAASRQSRQRFISAKYFRGCARIASLNRNRRRFAFTTAPVVSHRSPRIGLQTSGNKRRGRARPAGGINLFLRYRYVIQTSQDWRAADAGPASGWLRPATPMLYAIERRFLD